MQLVTGGLGFIGAHTTRALLDLGEQCVLAVRHVSRPPEFIQDEIGSRVFIEQVDVNDTHKLIDLGKKYEITGIVHIAGSLTQGRSGPFEDIRTNMTSLTNVLQAAYEWKVKRISIASALGVYNGITSVPWREDQPIPCTASFSIEALKKAGEVFSSYFASSTAIECISLRIAAIYGPLYDPTRGSLVGRLVHAAVKHTQLDLENIRGSIHAEDGGDWCYVKDCGRAIALLQTARELRHQIYNVASGRPTRNRDIVAAVRNIVPKAVIDLPAGSDPNGLGILPYEDITRLREDTGFEPEFNVDTAIADYIAWLQAGNSN